jgi:hypothetical protein
MPSCSSIANIEPPQRWSMVSSLHRRRRGTKCGWRDEPERGSSLLGILSVVGTLGILAVIVLTLNIGSSPATVGTTLPGSPPTTTTGPQVISSEQQVADRAACQADYAALVTAISDYQTLNGSSPPAGDAWATAKSAGGPFLQSWPSIAPAFSLTWNGAVVSVVPAKGRASHGSMGTDSPPTGCFA